MLQMMKLYTLCFHQYELLNAKASTIPETQLADSFWPFPETNEAPTAEAALQIIRQNSGNLCAYSINAFRTKVLRNKITALGLKQYIFARRFYLLSTHLQDVPQAVSHLLSFLTETAAAASLHYWSFQQLISAKTAAAFFAVSGAVQSWGMLLQEVLPAPFSLSKVIAKLSISAGDQLSILCSSLPYEASSFLEAAVDGLVGLKYSQAVLHQILDLLEARVVSKPSQGSGEVSKVSSFDGCIRGLMLSFIAQQSSSAGFHRIAAHTSVEAATLFHAHGKPDTALTVLEFSLVELSVITPSTPVPWPELAFAVLLQMLRCATGEKSLLLSIKTAVRLSDPVFKDIIKTQRPDFLSDLYRPLITEDFFATSGAALVLPLRHCMSMGVTEGCTHIMATVGDICTIQVAVLSWIPIALPLCLAGVILHSEDEAGPKTIECSLATKHTNHDEPEDNTATILQRGLNHLHLQFTPTHSGVFRVTEVCVVIGHGGALTFIDDPLNCAPTGSIAPLKALTEVSVEVSEPHPLSIHADVPILSPYGCTDHISVTCLLSTGFELIHLEVTAVLHIDSLMVTFPASAQAVTNPGGREHTVQLPFTLFDDGSNAIFDLSFTIKAIAVYRKIGSSSQLTAEESVQCALRIGRLLNHSFISTTSTNHYQLLLENISGISWRAVGYRHCSSREEAITQIGSASLFDRVVVLSPTELILLPLSREITINDASKYIDVIIERLESLDGELRSTPVTLRLRMDGTMPKTNSLSHTAPMPLKPSFLPSLSLAKPLVTSSLFLGSVLGVIYKLDLSSFKKTPTLQSSAILIRSEVSSIWIPCGKSTMSIPSNKQYVDIAFNYVAMATGSHSLPALRVKYPVCPLVSVTNLM